MTVLQVGAEAGTVLCPECFTQVVEIAVEVEDPDEMTISDPIEATLGTWSRTFLSALPCGHRLPATVKVQAGPPDFVITKVTMTSDETL